MDEMVRPSAGGTAFLAGDSEMTRLVREHDWAATPLGAVPDWPATLRMTLGICLAAKTPIGIYWGEPLVLLYNDAFRALIGERHPQALGRPAREVFPEIWAAIEPMFKAVFATGEATNVSDALLPLLKDGRPENRWFDFSYNPIAGEDGRVVGIINIALETTGRMLAERRQTFLLELSDALRPLTDLREVQATTARLLRQQLGAARVVYAEDAGDGETVIVTQNDTEGVPGIEGRHRYADYGENLLAEMRVGRPVVRPDIANDPVLTETEKVAHAAVQLGATLNVPFVKNGKLLAILAVHHPEAHSFTSEEVALTQEAAERTWAATERVRGEAALRQSEARLRELNADLERQVVERSLARGRTWQVSPELLGVANREGFFTNTNPAWEQTLGWTEEEIARTPFIDLVHPDDLEKTLTAFNELAQGNPVLRFENRYRRKDGAYRWISWVAVPERDQFYCSGRDVTAAKEQEAELAERTAERDRMWETSPDLMLVVSFDGVFRRVNPAWTTILGYMPEELVEHHVNEFVVPDDHVETVGAYELAAQGGQPRIVNRYRHKDGSLRWISWTAAPAGNLTYATGRDITAEAERQAELEAAQEQLRQSQKMEAMGQLTGGVAHDFNNLLTPIIASLDMLLRRGVGSERERRLMDGALQSAERAKVLVQRLLAFARRQPLQPGPVDVASLVRGMADLIASTSGPRIDVRIELPDDLPPALADSNQLEMALLNLAVNARDAMPDAGVLTISAARESVRRPHSAQLRHGHYVRLSVQDTGTGMDEATLARAVEPFFSTKGVGRGTGLGLSMVHGLASQLGGGLTIASHPGEGTTVDLWLPLSTQALEEDGEEPRAPPRARGLGTALLVDDEDLVRMSTADMLTDLGYEVVEVSSAEEALRLIDEGLVPDLVVTDHLMPGLTGLDLARDLRARHPKMPVLIVSGYAAMDGIAPGFARLTKPFRAAELAAMLANPSAGQQVIET